MLNRQQEFLREYGLPVKIIAEKSLNFAIKFAFSQSFESQKSFLLC